MIFCRYYYNDLINIFTDKILLLIVFFMQLNNYIDKINKSSINYINSL